MALSTVNPTQPSTIPRAQRCCEDTLSVRAGMGRTHTHTNDRTHGFVRARASIPARTVRACVCACVCVDVEFNHKQSKIVCLQEHRLTSYNFLNILAQAETGIRFHARHVGPITQSPSYVATIPWRSATSDNKRCVGRVQSGSVLTPEHQD